MFRALNTEICLNHVHSWAHTFYRRSYVDLCTRKTALILIVFSLNHVSYHSRDLAGSD